MINGLPSLAEIEATNVDHLTGLADYLTAQAERIKRCFTEAHEIMGSVPWQGQGYNAAYARTGGDQVLTNGLAEQRIAAAAIARRGAENMLLAKAAALTSAAEGHAAGFEVRQDLVCDAHTPGRPWEDAVRLQPQANEISAKIRAQAASMAFIDQDTTSKLTTATASFGTLKFTEAPIPTNNGKPGNGIQLVDHHVPLTPGGPLPQDRDSDRPWEYNIDLKSGVLLAGPGNPNAGTGASLDDVWNELHRCFNCNFPIGGAPRDFPKVGDHLPLSVGMGSKGPNMPFPVEVTQVQKNADGINIEFKTLPGHVDGEGSTIHFRFYEDGGQLHLGIRGLIAHGPGAIEDFPRNITAPVERLGYTGVAYTTWQPYIDNLTRNIAAAKGIPLLNVRTMGGG